MPLAFEPPSADSMLGASTSLPSLPPSLNPFSVDAVLFAHAARSTRTQQHSKRKNKRSSSLEPKSRPPRAATARASADTMACGRCGLEISSKHLARHLREECLDRKVSCRSCGLSLRAEDLAYHEKNDCPATKRREKHFRSFKLKESRRESCPLGCGVEVQLLYMQRHLKEECRMRCVKCPNDGCDEMVPLAELAVHATKTCKAALRRSECARRSRAAANELVDCEKCGMQVVKKALPLHQRDECTFRPVECRRCGVTVPFRDFAEHDAGLCPVLRRRERMLSRAKIGGAAERCPWCDTLLPPHKMNAHWRTTCTARFVRCAAPTCSAMVRLCDLEAHQERDLFYGLHKVPCCRASAERSERAARARRREVEELSCPLLCGVVLPAKQLSVHVREACPNRKIRCSVCRRKLKAVDMARHLEYECEKVKENYARARRATHNSEKVPCTFGCGCVVRRTRMKVHTSEECALRLVRCRLGCGQNVPLARMEYHVRVDCEVGKKRDEVIEQRRLINGWEAPWKDAPLDCERLVGGTELGDAKDATAAAAAAIERHGSLKT